eukprot:1157757-Pelagomonas_calceolata.AAC.6
MPTCSNCAGPETTASWWSRASTGMSTPPDATQFGATPRQTNERLPSCIPKQKAWQKVTRKQVFSAVCTKRCKLCLCMKEGLVLPESLDGSRLHAHQQAVSLWSHEQFLLGCCQLNMLKLNGSMHGQKGLQSTKCTLNWVADVFAWVPLGKNNKACLKVEHGCEHRKILYVHLLCSAHGQC